MTRYLRFVAPVAVLIALVVCVSLQAQTPEIDALRARAEQGDALAQVNLGNRHRRGDGVPQDDAEALRWNRLAADQGGTVKAYQAGDIKGSANPPGGQN